MPERLGAQLKFVTSVNDVRYVRVDINVMLASRRQIALLAHELQHALEIAERPDITDVDAMESLFEDIGFQSFENGRHRSYETDAALDVQEAVEHELGGRQRPAAQTSS
jgi:UDP-N-acetylglucosamine enolpyruvyl transferase